MNWINLFKRGIVGKKAQITEGVQSALDGAPAIPSLSKQTSIKINAVYACVNIISNAVASLPLGLYRKTDNGREKIEDHRLAKLLRRPSADMSAFNFKEALTVNLLIYGNAYIEKVLGRSGDIIELNLIESDKVSTRRRADGSIKYTVSTSKGTKIADEGRLIHVAGKSFTGKVGKSPVELCLQSIAFSKALEEYGHKYFSEGARPSGFLTTPNIMTPDAQRNILSSFRDEYCGSSNSGKIAILTEGLQFQQAQNGNDSSQFLETRRYQVEEIARIFQVPLFLLQSTEKSTSWGSGLEQLNISFVQHCLSPYLKRIEEALNYNLLTGKDDDLYFEFDVNGLLRGDMQGRFAAYHQALSDGWMSINEVREKENLPKVEGGDGHFVPLNMGRLAPDGSVEETNEDT